MSKELEALKYFKNAYNSFLKNTNDMFCKITISREQANEFVEEVEQAEKEHKVLEIIKDKLVDVFKLYNCKTIEEYNQAQYRDCMLTKEEFNLLKEVLFI